MCKSVSLNIQSVQMQAAENFKVSLIGVFNSSSWVQQHLPWRLGDVHSLPWVRRGRTQAGRTMDWQVEGRKRLDRLVLALLLAPVSTTLFRLSTRCRRAWKCQLVTLRSSHLPGVLSWDSISQVLGMGIAKVCLGQPLGLAWSRGTVGEGDNG